MGEKLLPKLEVVVLGGTMRREQKTFARSWVTPEGQDMMLQEEVDPYLRATDSAVEERKMSGTVLYKEEGATPHVALTTMIKESAVQVQVLVI